LRKCFLPELVAEFEKHPQTRIPDNLTSEFSKPGPGFESYGGKFGTQV